MNYCIQRHERPEKPMSDELDAVCEAPAYNFLGIPALSDMPQIQVSLPDHRVLFLLRIEII
jgi:hypothetical protein